MSKPSWDEAPEGAKYLAMDSDGSWYWHWSCPIARIGEHDGGKDFWDSDDRVQLAEQPAVPMWEETLEPRP